MSIFNWPVVKELVPHSVQQNKISTHLYIFALFNTPITTVWIYGIKKLDILSISSVLLVSESIIIVLVLCTSGTVTVCWKLLWNANLRFHRYFQRTVTAPLVHKTGNFIIYSETRRSELIDNKCNFEIP